MSPSSSGRSISQKRNHHEACTKQPDGFLRHVPPKRQPAFNGLHGVISQKIEMFKNWYSCIFIEGLSRLLLKCETWTQYGGGGRDFNSQSRSKTCMHNVDGETHYRDHLASWNSHEWELSKIGEVGEFIAYSIDPELLCKCSGTCKTLNEGINSN
jgi:hypothetical protein